MKRKSTNKGYTLVELLVAMAIFVIMLLEVYSVMSNSSTVYRKGSYEVQLQTEAQQAILQLEDIMVDCNGSVSYDNATKTLTVSDNVIDPSTGSVTPLVYTIKYEPATTAVEGTTQYFGTLTYQKTGMAAPIPFADYVEDFDVDMSTYTNDNVTVYLKFANEDYAYTASEDIYFRNEIGSGGSGSSEDTSGAKKFLDVLRFQEYNLATMYDYTKDGYKYDFKEFYFKDASLNKKYETTEYTIDSSTYKLKIKSSYNSQGNQDKEYGPYMMYATGTKTKLSDGTVTPITDSDPLLIEVSTKKVSWGFDSYNYYYLPGAEPSYAATGLTQFQGISLAKAKKVTYSYGIQTAAGYHYDGDSDGTTNHTLFTATKDSSSTGTAPSSQGENSTVTYYCSSSGIGNGWKIVKESDGSVKEYQCQLPQLYGYIDTTSNAVVAYNNKQVWNYDRCSEYINSTNGMLKAGHKFYIQVTVEWESPDVTHTFKTYLYPTNRDLTSDEKDLLEGQH